MKPLNICFPFCQLIYDIFVLLRFTKFKMADKMTFKMAAKWSNFRNITHDPKTLISKSLINYNICFQSLPVYRKHFPCSHVYVERSCTLWLSRKQKQKYINVSITTLTPKRECYTNSVEWISHV